MNRHPPPRSRVLPVLVALAGLVLAACSAGTTGARSTSDPRVKPLVGQVPPALPATGTWINTDAPRDLASLRGQVVYVQHAFPT